LGRVSKAASSRAFHSRVPTMSSAGACAPRCAAAWNASARSAGPTVVEEVPDGVGFELRVDHHYDGTDLQDAEQRPDEIGAVAKRDDHPLLGRHSRRTEHVGVAVRQRLNLAVAPPPGIGEQRGPVSPTLAHPRIEKEVGDVELRGIFDGHG
jgi:hypothetical protein